MFLDNIVKPMGLNILKCELLDISHELENIEVILGLYIYMMKSQGKLFSFIGPRFECKV